jgi:hypothetical protein
MKQFEIRSSRLIITTLLVFAILPVQPFRLVATAQGSASMLVNSTGDEADSSVGDGHCDTDGNTANGDQCTLRAAIQETNATPANLIEFNLPPNSTIVLNSELEPLTGMTIHGPGSGLLTIKRNPAPGTPQFRIFTVSAPAGVFMNGLTLTNGRAPDGAVNNGGAGGGILSFSMVLQLRDMVITGNRAGDGKAVDAEHPTGGSGGAGGGIGSLGPLTLIDCVITQNRAGDGTYTTEGGGGGGVAAGRGGLMINTVISDNVAGRGGTDQLGGRGGNGGGLSAGGVMTVMNSSITGNRSGRGGDSTVAFSGGIGGDGGGMSNSARMDLINTTISGNETGAGGTGTRDGGLGGSGGGIHNTAVQLIIANCTITGNRTNGSFGGSGGGIYSPILGIGILRNTIVANNTVWTGGQGPDLNGNFNSEDYNLIKNTSTASITGVTTHNITGQDPKLGPLSNNGGFTLTHGLLAGSPALNAGNNGNLLADSSDLDNDGNVTEPVPFDQRGAGFPRVLDGTVDIGAFEGFSLTQPPLQLALDSSGPAADQLAALDSMLLVRDPFRVTRPASVITQPADSSTRIVVFALNLNLAPGESASSVTVTLIDSQGQTVQTTAEDVRAMPGSDLTQVMFVLPNNLAPGTCSVKLSAQARVSNTGTIRII